MDKLDNKSNKRIEEKIEGKIWQKKRGFKEKDMRKKNGKVQKKKGKYKRKY